MGDDEPNAEDNGPERLGRTDQFREYLRLEDVESDADADDRGAGGEERANG